MATIDDRPQARTAAALRTRKRHFAAVGPAAQSFCNSRNRCRGKKILLFLALLPAVLASFCLAAEAATPEKLQAAMARHLSCFPLQLVDLNQPEIAIGKEELCLAAIYIATGMKPLWVSEKGPGARAEIIIRFLENAASEGLRTSDYNVQEIRSLWQSRLPDHLAQLDTRLTLNLVKYAHDVSHGKIIPFIIDPKLYAEAGDPQFKPVQIVEQALAAPDLADYLAALPPSHEYYRNLRQALQFYREIARAGGWGRVEDGKMLHPGDRDARIRQVRQRLARSGDPVPAAEDETVYDGQLVPAVKKFQQQYGLADDGIIGRKTMAALNTSQEEIIGSIILNMNRWRWQEKELGRRYIMVNIANYDLRAMEEGREVLAMSVIVGKLQHQTPVFSRRIRYVDFHPFWNIPPSIAQNAKLVELRKDPFYLVNREVRLFSGWQADAVELDLTAIDWHSVTRREMRRYKLRQDPGPMNALGPVKFVFPNTYNVYIHGTPAQELFEHHERSFSYGCIRASQPLDLAWFVLSAETGDWTPEKIREVVDRGERRIANVSTPLPVHITYQTVWVDNQGTIRFNTDIYGRDRKLAKILFASTDNAARITSTIWNE